MQRGWTALWLDTIFHADRCFNTDSLKTFNKGKITADELVTMDCCLMEMKEITKEEVKVLNGTGVVGGTKADKNVAGDGVRQYLAIIIRPEIEPSYLLEGGPFTLCGYDLVDIGPGISAITNCGAEFDEAIDYGALNFFGLYDTYREAVNAQLDLNEKYEDSHAYCEIVEIWRCLF